MSAIKIDIQHDSIQPARPYETVKIHKFDILEDITVVNLKFRSIIYQIGTFAYNAAKVMSD